MKLIFVALSAARTISTRRKTTAFHALNVDGSEPPTKWNRKYLRNNQKQPAARAAGFLYTLTRSAPGLSFLSGKIQTSRF